MAAPFRNMFFLCRKTSTILSVKNVKHYRLLNSYCNSDILNVMSKNLLPSITRNNSLLEQLPTQKFELPPLSKSYLEIYDSIPLMDINLPSVNLPNDKPNSILPNINEMEVSEPGLDNKEGILCRHGMLKIRRKKMNKHKLQKRKKRDRAKMRKMFIKRGRIQNKKRAAIKKVLIQKIEKIKENNPKSTYAERPYVIHRLTNW